MWRLCLVSLLLILVSACAYLGDGKVIKVPQNPNPDSLSKPQSNKVLYPIPDVKLPVVKQVTITPPEL